jgi:hypothetical protein
MELKTLCELFGVPPSTTSRLIRNAEVALEQCLVDFPPSAIKWPSFEEQMKWSRMVERRRPLVQNKWGFIDGKNYRIQKPTSVDLQNAHYNGWLHNVFVTGTYCFGASGLMVWGKQNCPGSWNDGEICRPFCEKLLNPRKSLQTHGVLADSAFPVSGELWGRIITPLKKNDMDRIPIEDRAGSLRLNAQIIDARQAAEWGMGAVEKCFRRLLLPLPYDPVVRRRRLSNLNHLYNYRVRTTGISQIANVYREFESGNEDSA